MTLNNFESELDPVIVERGRDYFLSGAVTDLEEEDAFAWRAIVSGSDDYEVSVFFEEDEVIDWNCDCPYEYGPVCKHVSAVLYAIRDYEKKNARRVKAGKVKPSEMSRQTDGNKVSDVNHVIDNLSLTEIQDFLKRQMKQDKELRSRFLMLFADRLTGKQEDIYRNLIRSAFNRAADSHGFISFPNASSFSRQMLDMVSKAQQTLSIHNLQEALEIIKPIIEEMPEITNHLDDSNGYCTLIAEESFNILLEIARKAPTMLKDELFNYCTTEFPLKKYRYYGWEHHFLDILPELITTERQERIYLQLLDDEILKEKKGDYPEFNVTRLLETKAAYFDKTDQSELVETLLKPYLNYDGIRHVLIDRAVKAKEYLKVKELCQERLNQGLRRKTDGLPVRFLDWLYKIAVLEQDQAEIRLIADLIFHESPHEIEHFLNLKKSWAPENWGEKLDEILVYLSGNQRKQSVFHTITLATIYVEEGMKDKLMGLLCDHADNLSLLDDFASSIDEEDLPELLTCYETGIMKLAEKVGRPAYERVAGYLVKIMKIKGGTEVASKIASALKQKYNYRPAMLEILEDSLRIK